MLRLFIFLILLTCLVSFAYSNNLYPSDLDKDGKVTIMDVMQVVGDWGNQYFYPEFNLLYPTENSLLSNEVNIKWTFNSIKPVTFDILYSLDNGSSWNVIVKNTENDGIHTWNTNSINQDNVLLKFVGDIAYRNNINVRNNNVSSSKKIVINQSLNSMIYSIETGEIKWLEPLGSYCSVIDVSPDNNLIVYQTDNNSTLDLETFICDNNGYNKKKVINSLTPEYDSNFVKSRDWIFIQKNNKNYLYNYYIASIWDIETKSVLIQYTRQSDLSYFTSNGFISLERNNNLLFLKNKNINKHIITDLAYNQLYISLDYTTSNAPEFYGWSADGSKFLFYDYYNGKKFLIFNKTGELSSEFSLPEGITLQNGYIFKNVIWIPDSENLLMSVNNNNSTFRNQFIILDQLGNIVKYIPFGNDDNGFRGKIPQKIVWPSNENTFYFLILDRGIFSYDIITETFHNIYKTNLNILDTPMDIKNFWVLPQ